VLQNQTETLDFMGLDDEVISLSVSCLVTKCSAKRRIRFRDPPKESHSRRMNNETFSAVGAFTSIATFWVRFRTITQKGRDPFPSCLKTRTMRFVFYKNNWVEMMDYQPTYAVIKN